MRGLYVDSSAFVKLVLDEAESEALRDGVEGRRLFSSRLLEVEAMRAARRSSTHVTTAARRVLERVSLFDFDESVVRRATIVQPPLLRSLDAIHLATADELRADIVSFVTYDRRLGDAARAMGFEVVSPGAG